VAPSACAAASLGQDAAAVWYHDQYLPVYYEVVARVRIEKPTAGWKGNAYVVFDYFSPFDFKFAGLNDSVNKLVMGYRDASGWHITAQAAIPAGVRYDRWYDLTIAVNGTVVTVGLDGQTYFTSRSGRGSSTRPSAQQGPPRLRVRQLPRLFDNVALQVLPQPTSTGNRVTAGTVPFMAPGPGPDGQRRALRGRRRCRDHGHLADRPPAATTRTAG
jgi:hypothetical protein